MVFRCYGCCTSTDGLSRWPSADESCMVHRWYCCWWVHFGFVTKMQVKRTGHNCSVFSRHLLHILKNSENVCRKLCWELRMLPKIKHFQATWHTRLLHLMEICVLATSLKFVSQACRPLLSRPLRRISLWCQDHLLWVWEWYLSPTLERSSSTLDLLLELVGLLSDGSF